MKTIQIEPVLWSEEKQRRLQESLVGKWATDTWELISQKGVRRWMCFFPIPLPLKTELQYAAWHKFHTGEWCLEHDQRHHCEQIMHLVDWLNRAKPDVQSFMEKPLEYWIMSLRSYLVETNEFKQERSRFLRATQTYAEYRNEDARISLFRHLYGVIANAYDDRAETEKDVWDMRKLGLPVNQTRSHYTLNFAPITQPWLRALTKEFMKYNMAVRSPGSCFTSLAAVREFSLFLAHDLPHAQASDIDRALVLKYLHFLQMQKHTVARRNSLLKSLRTFLETCAYRLPVDGLTKERFIFEDDFAKEPEALSREIPAEVLEQLREHLGTLDTTTLRMVTILLECGLRCINADVITVHPTGCATRLLQTSGVV
jgi:integrase/recombinase XerD